MLLTKVRNAAELCWDSLDSQERQVLLYLAGYLIFAVALSLRAGSRERLKRELREELQHGGA